MGLVAFEGRVEVDPDLVVRATRSLAHRGPDGEGFWLTPQAGLGFRRLAVIDLSSAADQPFVNESGDIAIVCNGEIFNHQELRRELSASGHEFRSLNDCEVCLHAYEEFGVGFVSRLQGMFAVAVVDLRRRRLLLARDRLGVKPLFYRANRNQVCFASELKALRCDPGFEAEIDPLALNLYLVQDAVPAPFTIYRGVRKVEPAQILEFDLDQGSVSEKASVYWRLPLEEEPKSRSADDLEEELLHRLTEAVRSQMMSDVPIGIFLSGGMDSSAVLALMRAHDSRPIVTFTLGFDDTENDESEIARGLARDLQTEHHEIRLGRDVLEAADEVLPHFDEPFGDSSAIPTYQIAALARRHVPVVLTGEGGDELFGGYLRPRDAVAFRWATRLGERRRMAVAAMVAKTLPISKVGRFCLPDWALTASLHHRIVDPLRRSVIRRHWHRPLDEIVATYETLKERLETRKPMQGYFDGLLSRYLPDDLLVKVDRMSSAHGLESRVPLLDHRLVELAARMPTRFKMNRSRTKVLFRKAMAGIVPASVLGHEKRGFGLPPSYSRTTSWRKKIESLALECSAVGEIVDLKSVERWDGPTCWRALALATWIGRCHEE